jgi:Zn-dependent protease with chaperone function
MFAALALAAFLSVQTPAQIEARHQADIQADIKWGKELAAEAERQYKLSDNKAMIDRVQRIGNEMAAIARVNPMVALWGDSRLNPFPYTFKVLKSDEINAFSLPGGHIYVFEGLVNYIESDDELAAVLGHEISHAAFRHVRYLEHEQNKIDLVTIPLILLSIIKGGESSGGGAMMGQLLNTAMTNGWSNKAELAADYGGFQILVKSKYNPTAMLTLNERFMRDERSSPVAMQGIFQTHPPSRERALAILKYMAARHIPVQRSLVTTTFRTSATGGALRFGKLPLVTLAGADGPARAAAAAAGLNKMFDATPALYEITRSGDDIVYRYQPILHLEQSDADAAGLSLDALGDKTLKNIRGCLFTIGFDIWDENP